MTKYCLGHEITHDSCTNVRISRVGEARCFLLLTIKQEKDEKHKKRNHNKWEALS